MRGAICNPSDATGTPCYFNSRSPCGERSAGNNAHYWNKGFQLTLPMRGAIKAGDVIEVAGFISTHAPHAGSDPRPRSQPGRRRYFNSRSPCGERYDLSAERDTSFIFQLTLPMRGAIGHRAIHRRRVAISTHAPHAGSDRITEDTCCTSVDFNSRSPCGERLQRPAMRGNMHYFNSRSPCGERS